MWRKWKAWTLVCRTVNWNAVWRFLQKIKLSCNSAIPIYVFIQGNKTPIKKIYTHPPCSLQHLFTTAKIWKESVFINIWIDKEDVVNICNGILLMTNLDSNIQKQRHYFANKGSSSQGYGFSCGHVWMWELDYEEGWAPKNWCFWTVVLEKILESPLDCKEIQPVHSEGNQPWDFFGRNDAKAETPVLWPPHEKSWLIGKDSDAGRDRGQEEKGTTEGEMAGWHH